MHKTKTSKRIIKYSKKTRKNRKYKMNCKNVTTYEIKRIRKLTKNVIKKNNEIMKKKINDQ
jgi:hypothetical protein